MLTSLLLLRSLLLPEVIATEHEKSRNSTISILNDFKMLFADELETLSTSYLLFIPNSRREQIMSLKLRAKAEYNESFNLLRDSLNKGDSQSISFEAEFARVATILRRTTTFMDLRLMAQISLDCLRFANYMNSIKFKSPTLIFVIENLLRMQSMVDISEELDFLLAFLNRPEDSITEMEIDGLEILVDLAGHLRDLRFVQIEIIAFRMIYELEQKLLEAIDGKRQVNEFLSEIEALPSNLKSFKGKAKKFILSYWHCLLIQMLKWFPNETKSFITQHKL
jgi:hypothetical protein